MDAAILVTLLDSLSYIVAGMYWPLIGGLVAFILLCVLMGWIMDPSRRGDSGSEGH